MIYADKWDIFDIRFMGIWFTLSNLPGFILDRISIGNNLPMWFFVSLILLLAFPFLQLIISADNKVKKWILSIVCQYKWIYSIAGFTCFGLMMGYILYFVIQSSGIIN